MVKQMRSKEILPLWVRVDPSVMAMKGYSIFPKAPGLESYHLMVYCDIHDTWWWGVLTFCKNAISIFYSAS